MDAFDLIPIKKIRRLRPPEIHLLRRLLFDPISKLSAKITYSTNPYIFFETEGEGAVTSQDQGRTNQSAVFEPDLFEMHRGRTMAWEQTQIPESSVSPKLNDDMVTNLVQGTIIPPHPPTSTFIISWMPRSTLPVNVEVGKHEGS